MITVKQQKTIRTSRRQSEKERNTERNSKDLNEGKHAKDIHKKHTPIEPQIYFMSVLSDTI